MKDILFFPVGTTQACNYASDFLRQYGISLTDHPTPEVTHLLLDVPSFDPKGNLRDGTSAKAILERIPPSVTVVGGNLTHPVLNGYKCLDLLNDAFYLAQNASITAECAVQAAAPHLATTWSDTPTLIIGWGRIGKCLSLLLHKMGADVTVAVKKEADLAMVRALQMQSTPIEEIDAAPSKYRLLFNTVPESIISEEELSRFQNCVKIELASKPGLEGSGIVHAKGLPGIYAPESSGKLITSTIMRLLKEDLT